MFKISNFSIKKAESSTFIKNISQNGHFLIENTDDTVKVKSSAPAEVEFEQVFYSNTPQPSSKPAVNFVTEKSPDKVEVEMFALNSSINRLLTEVKSLPVAKDHTDSLQAIFETLSINEKGLNTFKVQNSIDLVQISSEITSVKQNLPSLEDFNQMMDMVNRVPSIFSKISTLDSDIREIFVNQILKDQQKAISAVVTTLMDNESNLVNIFLQELAKKDSITADHYSKLFLKLQNTFLNSSEKQNLLIIETRQNTQKILENLEDVCASNLELKKRQENSFLFNFKMPDLFSLDLTTKTLLASCALASMYYLYSRTGTKILVPEINNQSYIVEILEIRERKFRPVFGPVSSMLQNFFFENESSSVVTVNKTKL